MIITKLYFGRPLPNVRFYSKVEMESTTSSAPSFSEEKVPRPIWEPRHEWESRVKFVEDNIADYGLDQSLNLSLVWANMNFLGCRYPSGTEALVQHYPIPSMDELKQRRKKKAKMKSFAEVTALLSSAHTQSSLAATHIHIQTIANELCMCKECLKQDSDKAESFSRKGMKLLECYKQQESAFTYDISEKEGEGNEVWVLKLNGEIVMERSGGTSRLMEEFVKILHNWQEANQKPPCPVLAKQQQEQGESGDTSQNYGDTYDSRLSGYSSGSYNTPDYKKPNQGGYDNNSYHHDQYQGSPNFQNSYRGSPGFHSGSSHGNSPSYQGGRGRGNSPGYRGGGHGNSPRGYGGEGSSYHRRGGYRGGEDAYVHGPDRKRGRYSSY